MYIVYCCQKFEKKKVEKIGLGFFKLRIVEKDNWLYLNKRPCWDSICDPFASEANPWTAGLHYLTWSLLVRRTLFIYTSTPRV